MEQHVDPLAFMTIIDFTITMSLLAVKKGRSLNRILVGIIIRRCLSQTSSFETLIVMHWANFRAAIPCALSRILYPKNELIIINEIKCKLLLQRHSTLSKYLEH